ncbi:MAG: LD-carboxypeptidase [Victivallales bacterium]|nr:LD-carboxypeptidase [Victivallales bacterium]
MEGILKSQFKHAAIIAPAGIPDKEKVADAVAWLEQSGIRTRIMPHVFSENAGNYLSAPLKDRLRDLHACWRDQAIDLIFCARGGFGSAQLLPHINWNLLRTRRIPLIGYSDITALHLAMIKERAGTPVAAPMPTVFKEALINGKEKDYTRHYLNIALAKSIPAGTEIVCPGNDKPVFIKPGYALGQPLTANLSVLASLCGTPWLPSMTHKILILEDLNEDIYKLDRSLTQLQQCGVFARCAAVFFGQFNNCGTGEEQYELFERFAAAVRGPVIAGFPFGHEFPSISINLRHYLRLEKNGRIFLIDT